MTAGLSSKETMKKNLVLCYPVEPQHLAKFADDLPHLNIINAGQEAVADRIHEADFFVGHAKVPVDWDTVVASGRLQLIQSSAAGLDHCLVPSVIDSDIVVCSASGLFSKQVAEQTMALLAGVIRSMPTFFRQHVRREFVRQPTDDLAGKRVGIVGFGGNGRRIAQVLSPFDVEIRATDYFPVAKPEFVKELWSADRLIELASVSDVLILALPLNAMTKAVITEDVFAAMPRGSYLINVARGQVVDELAMLEALRSGQLAAAGLDVTETEPLPADHPLWELDNILITPHVGAQSARRVSDSTEFACQNLKRFMDGIPPLNLVDKKLGFPAPESMAFLQS